jgi:hypothetical protein
MCSSVSYFLNQIQYYDSHIKKMGCITSNENENKPRNRNLGGIGVDGRMILK